MESRDRPLGGGARARTKSDVRDVAGREDPSRCNATPRLAAHRIAGDHWGPRLKGRAENARLLALTRDVYSAYSVH